MCAYCVYIHLFLHWFLSFLVSLWCIQKPISCQEPALQSWLWNCTKRQFTGMNQMPQSTTTSRAACLFDWQAELLPDWLIKWEAEWVRLQCTTLVLTLMWANKFLFFYLRFLPISLLVCFCISPLTSSSLSLSFSPLLHQTQKATLWSNLEATLPLSLRSFFLLSAVAATLDW